MLVSTVVEQYDYVYHGSSLTRMVKTTTTTADEETTTSTDTLFFAYDASGSPLAVTYNNTDYYYTANIQGDIVGIVDNTGTQVVSYTYDAWGNALTVTGTLSETLGSVNPLRYRGYVYDTDTELFYLQSRYYNPEIGRFINGDALVSTGQGLLGNNMFAYCLNNPAGCSDPSGLFASPVPCFDRIQECAKDLAEFVENTIAEIRKWKEKHVDRNAEQDAYMDALLLAMGSEAAVIEHIEDNWEKQGFFKNLYHINIYSEQYLNALTNVKYLSPDGQYEVVICYPWFSDPYIVTSSVNRGTANYGTDSAFEHFLEDMLPYYLWGNDGDGAIGDIFHDLFSGG